MLTPSFHLDHCGAVPYLTEKTPFKAPIFMTYPTKAIYKHVLGDSLKVYDGDKVLFDSQDILNSLDKISVVNFHQEVEVDGIKFICYAAGHVLGACMFLIDIAGTKILYTGDYSREEDRHIKGAEIPQTKVDVLIVESTYGIKTHDPREIREKRFIETVRNIVVDRNGHCLLPVFVLGRAQEILLILEEYWNRKPEMQNIPIYYASTLMAKCMIIFQTYINMMGDAIKESFKRGINPFNFKNISILKNIDNLDNNQPSVVMASPGMLQKGLSRTLFEKWCSCAQNGVVFTGYCVESTLAREILSGRKEIRRADGIDVPIKMSVHNISFSAHADFVQTRDFIKTVDPTQVILVHGESHEADRMKKDLEVIFPEKQFFVPKNWQIVEIEIESKIVDDRSNLDVQGRGQTDHETRREAPADHREKEKRVRWLQRTVNETAQGS
jgi:cleavage and polyadenylation specificity factor subunit 3